MMAEARRTRRTFTRLSRRAGVVVCAALVFALVGCKSDKDAKGMGVSRGRDNDPLIAGPGSMIPKQNVPLPDRATGPKGKPDPLVSPTGGKAGYTEDPARFKGTVIPGKSNTPAALAGRLKDGDELKIDDGGVPLTPAGGTLPGGALEAPAGVEPLLAQFDKLGVKREDRSLARENGKWVFLASVPNARGAKTQYRGEAATPAEAVRQVLDQVTSDRK